MRVFVNRVDIVVTQAGVLHDKKSMSAWLERSKASIASKKATGLKFGVGLVLLEAVISWVILVHPLLDIFIDLNDGVSLGFHVKRSLIHLVDVMILLLHLYHDYVVGGS